MFITLVSFALVFTLIALVHEFGHLVWAKRAGIRVHELALGFGPRIFSFKKNDTSYSINLVPILGYVKIAGEGENEEDKACPEAEKFYAKTPLQKFKALAAGPAMNILLSFVLLSLLFAFAGIPKEVSNEIGLVNKNSPAEKAGLRAGDKILAINGKSFAKMDEAIRFIHQSSGKELALAIDRAGTRLQVKASPKYNPKLKVALLGFSPKPIYERANPLLALYYGLEQTASMVLLTLAILGQLVVGAVSVTDLAGPVGIAQITGKYAQAGIISLTHFTAFISVNIGVLNLLPLPALDGGHILFTLIEWIRRKPVNRELENKINYWGLVVLLGLMALVTINDVFRWLRTP